MLSDDQIEKTEAVGALDELSKRINAKKDTLSAIGAVGRFEEALEKAMQDKNKLKKEVIDTEEEVSQEDLLNGIKDDMTR